MFSLQPHIETSLIFLCRILKTCYVFCDNDDLNELLCWKQQGDVLFFWCFQSSVTNFLVPRALCAMQREVLFSLFNFIFGNISILSCSLLPVHKLKIPNLHFRFQKFIDCLAAQAATLDHSWLLQFSPSDNWPKLEDDCFMESFQLHLFWHFSIKLKLHLFP